MEYSAASQISSLFAGTIEAMSAVAAQSEPRERAAIIKAIQTIRSTQPLAEKLPTVPQTSDVAPRLASGIAEPDSHDRAALRAFGHDLTQRRKMAGLTREVLAERAGISVSTLRNVEKGLRPPTRTTIMHLQSVPELRIETAPPQLVGRGSHDAAFAPNCWLAPEYDAIKLHHDMKLQFAGRGGHIEQTYIYLDPTSAAAWCAFAEQESYTRRRMSMPIGKVAEVIAQSVGGAGVDVIGLGCGDGRDEVRLAQCLLERPGGRNLRIYMLDISQPLCCAAYRHAAHVLGDNSAVSIYAIQGSFHNLQRYSQLLATPQRAHRRRVLCMFGNTFANVDNEVLFVRNSLVGFNPGDLFLFTVGQAMAPADQPDEILRKDPRLSRKIAASTGLSRFDQQLIDVVSRYVENTRGVELTSVLDRTACVVPGSYSADVVATAKLGSGESKQFSIAHLRRYDRALLDQTMHREGWEPVANWLFDTEYHPTWLLLYRRSSTERS